MANYVTVKRLNKVLTVPETRLEYYLNEGYDQIENGEVVRPATGGRTVSVVEYNKLLERVKDLELENKALRALAEEEDPKKRTTKKSAK